MTARILVIDDNDLARQAIGAVLESAGYEVSSAAGGEEGVAKFRAEGCDLVITDIMMPSIDGIELMREIRHLRPDARILAVSGYTLLHTLPPLGASDTLGKPFDSEELLAKVASCLASPARDVKTAPEGARRRSVPSSSAGP